MAFLFYMACFLTLTAHSQGFVIKDTPSFCKNLDCPRYKVVNKTADFEERCYPSYNWVSTDISDEDYDIAIGTGFERLFKYISGANKQKVKIPMTVPVAIEMEAGAGAFCKSTCTESFFVPFKDQENPPKPTDEKVYISNYSEHCQYVASYPGISTETLVKEMVAKLAAALDKAGKGSTYYKDTFFFAGYDSPFQLLHRHNEVWFIKKSGNVVN